MEKFKKIFCIFLMVVISVSLTALVVTLSARIIIKKDSMLKILDKANYYSATAQNINERVTSYINNEKVKNVVNEGKIKRNIEDYINVLGKQEVEDAKANIRADIEKDFIQSLNDVEDKNKGKLSTILSNIYMSSLFPVDEINTVYKVILKYSSKLDLLCVVLGILVISSTVYLFRRKKQCKWLFVGIYNSLIILMIIYIILKSNANIYYTNDSFSSIINGMINKLSFSILIGILVTLTITMVLNYIKYFKARIRE